MNNQHASSLAGVFWSDSPVVVITSTTDGKINGQVAVTVVTSSIVNSKPRLLVGIWKGNYTHEFISNSRIMAIHLLKHDQYSHVRNFGFYTGREREKFKNIKYFKRSTGCPIVEDAHSYIECEVINSMDGGDMTAFMVNVVDGRIMSSGNWMTLNDFYAHAPQEWILEYEQKLSKSIAFSLPIIDKIDYTPFTP